MITDGASNELSVDTYYDVHYFFVPIKTVHKTPGKLSNLLIIFMNYYCLMVVKITRFVNMA